MTDLNLGMIFDDSETVDIEEYCEEKGVSIYEFLRSSVFEGLYK